MKKLFSTTLILILCFSLFSHNVKETDTEILSTNKTMYDISHNAVYSENILSFSYERLIPINEKFGLALKGGFLIWDPVIPLVEIASVTGRHKNYFEGGIGALIDPSGNDDGFHFLTFRIGYRYQATKGFLFKTSVIASPDNFILPLFTFGYAF